MNRNEINRILKLSLKAGRILLENGAETYRVEETINLICNSKGIENASCFVIPTGIFINLEYEGEYYSIIHRTNVKRVDLERIAMVNNFSRSFASGDLAVAYADKELEKINSAPEFKKWEIVLGGGIVGGFFSLLFGGGLIEFPLAFATSVLVIIFTMISDKYRLPFFVKNFIGGMINMLSTLVMVKSLEYFGLGADIDSIIIGSIMPLVPGLAIVNAIRDIISGDLVSGTSRMTEAVWIAVSLALGVGTILQGYIMIFGGRI
ncbi:Uncharacterized membrane protein YjjP, DUF1212 family [Dethiosulfatibacter aminovorans DSM 17477]|uniref:Uncharacterized membrane protein YjjP, DUF1212 family n=1 Tax=Dethiosulfatibacter aminovorans DSM 17477 TaxID=1121476 RepID=A0A1M6BTX7_9FIRM|nr:threonine/serine exporter family protein [Dethiosulfatibacter aminovorans]SHI52215.1 Uncharacterized membrane protein YjjP, DUF1212 family [Dethiosulfatibacter aminovorans DSM 17477]